MESKPTIDVAHGAPYHPRLALTEATLHSVPLHVRRRSLRREQFPHFLYKYRKVSGDTPESLERLRDVIVHGLLYLSPPRSFNDPFDMSMKITFKGTEEDRMRRIRALVRTQGADMDRKGRRELIKTIASKSSAEIKRDLSSAHERSVDELGVYSLAGDPRSILMWSHYGDEHQGICIQFDLARDLRIFLRAFPVGYSHEYPVVNWVDMNTPEALKSALTRKDEAWTYEREHRIIVPQGARMFLAMRPEALTGLIIGCRAGPGVYGAVDQLLDERRRRGLPAVRQYLAERHSERYEIVLRRK